MRPAAALVLTAALVHAALARAARADQVSPPPPTVEEIRAALVDNHISEAHRLAERYTAVHPDDPTAAYLAAAASMSMGRFDEAEGHLAAGLRAAPGDADLHGLRASIAVLRGDDATARAETSVALGLDPTQADALDTRAQIGLADRYAAHTSPALAPGSPAAFVGAFLDKLAARAPAAEVAAFVDPSILDHAPPALRGVSLEPIIEGAYESARTQMAAGFYRFVAWEVAPDAPGDVARVQILIENGWTADRVAMVKKLYADPQGRTAIDEETRRIFDGLDPADRDAAFDGLIGSHRRMVSTMEVPVVRVGADLKIADLRLNGMSVRDQLVPMVEHLMEQRIIDVPEPSRARRSAMPFDRILLLLAVLGGLLVVRFARSRRS